ncbi:MAG: GerMN domain-containing protein [Spirochaetes bacterium]|nr:GerMN domain-containing protein [Spirochaetota bacterium]
MAPAKKTAPGKTGKRQVKTRNSVPAVKPVQSSRAKYVLTIMILSAVILFIVSKNQKTSVVKKPAAEKKAEKQITEKSEMITAGKDKTDKNNSAASSEKPENKAVESEISVFYLVFQNDETLKYVPVKSTVKSDNIYADAMRILIAGPSASLKAKGYQSAFPEGVKVNDVKIKNRIAVIDLNSKIRENAVGDILTARINQIFYTMKNFPEIDGIEIRIDGNAVNTLGGDGHVFNWPLKRKL